MPLHILLPFVVFGIIGIALLLHLSGRSKLFRFRSENHARTEWLRAFPDLSPDQVTLAETGHAAIVQTDQGPGLIWGFGADCVAHLADNVEIFDAPRGLTIRFHDFATPNVTLNLTKQERPIWRAILSQEVSHG